MADKNFVVKHGLEVNTNLVFADATNDKVGIATTSPRYTLDVIGGIGATDFYLTGIGTFVDELNVGLGGTVLTVLGIGNSIGIGTSLPQYLLDIRSPVSTGQTALYVQGDIEVTGDIRADDVVFDDAQIQDLTVTDTFIVAGLSTFNSNVFINAALNVSGLTTLGGYIDINNSVDISGTLNVGGATTISGYTTINNSSNITGNIIIGGIGTIPTFNSTSGTITNLFGTNVNYSGIGTINTLTVGTQTNKATISYTTNTVRTLTIPNLSGDRTFAFINQDQTFNGTQTFNNLNVTGIATIASVSILGATLSTLNVTGTSILGITSATQLNVSGIGTIATLNSTSGTITNLTGTAGTIPTFNSTSSTITNLTGTAGTIATLNSTSGTITNLTGTAGTIATLNSTSSTITNLTGTNVNYSGIGTIATLNSTSGTITNLTGTAGTIATLNSTSGTITNLFGTNLNYSGIGTIPTFNSTSGTITNLFGTNVNYSGIGTINTLRVGTQTNKATISYATNVARDLTIPSLDGNRTFAFINQDQTFDGTQTFNNLNVTGVSELGNLRISSGIITATSGIITYFGDGSGLINTPPGSPAGSMNEVQYNDGVSFAGSPNFTFNGNDVNVVGIITALEFYGDGSGLTGTGSTVFNDTITDQEFFPLFTDTTTGTITASGISTSKLTYNPSTGTLTVVDLNSTSDITLKENIKTVENSLNTIEQLRGVSFDWKETGKSSYGVIAQELEEVLPELVKEGEIKSVNYNGLIGILIEAVKELKKEIEELKNTK